MATDNHPTDAPGPWSNTGQLYLLSLAPSKTLPKGAYAPLEAGSFFASPESGQFRGGGLGSATVQIVRYFDTPAGPYDELLYVPGAFDTPIGKKHLRCTRIYVSTDASTYNGRKNWNIPKHVARFSFTPLHPEQLNSPVKIEVFPPSPTDASPFFSAIVSTPSWIPSFPFNSDFVPGDITLAQPPLPALEPDASIVIGTDKWISILPNMKGKGKIVTFTPGGTGEGSIPPGEYADGVGFPKIRPYRYGIHVKNLTLYFPEGKVMDDEISGYKVHES